ncbi:MAG: hypothetical protein ABSF77_19780 [Spirochaetia bacterium]|jgi:hypothetical protein
MTSELYPTKPVALLHDDPLKPGSDPNRRIAFCGMELIDPYAIAAGMDIAQALHMHVASTSRPSALQDLADLGAAYGIASHAIRNVAHTRNFFLHLEPIALDTDGQGRS